MARPPRDSDSDPGTAPAARRSRRRHRRVAAEPLRARLVPRGGESPPAIDLVNLSLSGTALVTAEVLGEINEAFAIELDARRGGDRLRLSCRLRYVIGERPPGGADPRWLHGLRFDGLSGAASAFVQEWVAQRA